MAPYLHFRILEFSLTWEATNYVNGVAFFSVLNYVTNGYQRVQDFFHLLACRNVFTPTPLGCILHIVNIFEYIHDILKPHTNWYYPNPKANLNYAKKHAKYFFVHDSNV